MRRNLTQKQASLPGRQPTGRVLSWDSSCLKSHKEISVRSYSLMQRFSMILMPLLSLSCACNGTSPSSAPSVEKAASSASADSAQTQGFTGEGCARTGCSGQICGKAGESVMSTCVWREEYACYRTARCEMQSNGSCGWTPNESLNSCLKTARAR
ncbi:hypothetical protein EBU99_05210 [bacterium]|nr:hypothetical protein [bacterium]